MPRRWTAEQKAVQAEKIRQWKPWLKSTGPRTIPGKYKTSQNALKHGLRTAEWINDERRYNELLRNIDAQLKRFKERNGR